MMPKQCKKEDCSLNQFGGGYCVYHQHMRDDFKGYSGFKNKGRSKPLQNKNKPHSRSKKRSKEEQKYNKLRQSFIEYKKEVGEYRCIFCGKSFNQEPDIHHLLGRDNSRLNNVNDWELAHRGCHINYHSRSVKGLWWFEDYLDRIRWRFPNLYRREQLKKDKL